MEIASQFGLRSISGDARPQDTSFGVNDSHHTGLVTQSFAEMQDIANE